MRYCGWWLPVRCWYRFQRSEHMRAGSRQGTHQAEIPPQVWLDRRRLVCPFRVVALALSVALRYRLGMATSKQAPYIITGSGDVISRQHGKLGSVEDHYPEFADPSDVLNKFAAYPPKGGLVGIYNTRSGAAAALFSRFQLLKTPDSAA